MSTTLGERVRLARERNSITQTECAVGVGVTQAAIAALEKRKSQSCGYTSELAKVLKVSVDWLATGRGDMNGPGEPISSIPVRQWSDSFERNGEVTDWVVCSIGNISMSAFALRVRGISMEPEFTDQDTVIVDPDKTASHNDFIIVKLEEETTLKQLVCEGSRMFLRSLNPSWTPTLEEIENDSPIAGVVVAKTRTY